LRGWDGITYYRNSANQKNGHSAAVSEISQDPAIMQGNNR